MRYLGISEATPDEVRRQVICLFLQCPGPGKFLHYFRLCKHASSVENFHGESSNSQENIAGLMPSTQSAPYSWNGVCGLEMSRYKSFYLGVMLVSCINEYELQSNVAMLHQKLVLSCNCYTYLQKLKQVLLAQRRSFKELDLCTGGSHSLIERIGNWDCAIFSSRSRFFDRQYSKFGRPEPRGQTKVGFPPPAVDQPPI